MANETEYAISLGAVITALREVAAENPYRVAVRDGVAVYELNGCPDCLVGTVLARCGVSVETLADWDGRGDCALSSLTGDVIDSIDPVARLLLEEAQDLQDRGTPWGQVASVLFEGERYEDSPWRP